MNKTGSLANSKTTVKKLKNKRLTDFINDVAATIPDPTWKTSAGTFATIENKMRIVGKPHSLIDMEREQMLHQYQVGDDEPPLLFVGRRPIDIRKDSSQLQEIVNSYMAFKELSVDLEYPQDDCADFT